MELYFAVAKRPTQCGFTALDKSVTGERGSVLVTVLAMLAVLMTVLLTAMTYALSRYTVHKAHVNETRARWLADSGITRALEASRLSTIPQTNDTIKAPGGGWFTFETSPWGFHLLVRATGKCGGQEVIRWALIGSSGDEFTNAAVVSGDESLPLVISGSTRIRGTGVVGLPGIIKGRIRGEGPVYEDFHVGGTQLRDRIDLPAPDTAVLGEYLRDMRFRRANPDRVLTGSQAPNDISTLVDFGDEVIEVENHLILKNINWSNRDPVLRTLSAEGRIEIGGRSRISTPCELIADYILVQDSAVVDRVLLWARDSIVFCGSAVFSGMALSPGRIVVRERARLLYPSELVAYTLANPTADTTRLILSGTELAETSAFAVSLADDRRDDALVYVDTGKTILGCVFSNDEIDLRGSVLGSVISEHFRYEQHPTTYVNWLKDCYIDRTGLTYEPVLPLCHSDSEVDGRRIVRRD